MTANWAGVLVIVLITAFFALAVLGIGMGAYAASALKKLEARIDKASTES